MATKADLGAGRSGTWAGLVAAFAALAGAGDALAYTTTQTQNQTVAGQNHLFTFTNLPAAAGAVSVKVDLYGDYNLSTKYAEVWIDGTKQAFDVTGTNYCGTSPVTRTYGNLAASTVADGTLAVRVDLSADVALPCTTIVERVVVTVSYSDMDLDMASFAVTPATLVGAGGTTTATFAVRNAGGDAANDFVVSIYYGDSTSTSGLTLLATRSLSVAAYSTSVPQAVTLTMPGIVLNGTRYLHYFIDSIAAFTESDETDNRGYQAITLTGTPDLRVTTLTAAPTSQVPGGQVSLTYRVQNAGSTRTNAASTLRFYYSEDATITTGDTHLNVDRTIPIALNAGAYEPAVATGTVTVTVPASAVAGTRYFGAYADVGNTVNEGPGEDDNTRAVAITVARPDLEMASWSSPVSAEGFTSEIAVSFSVRNAGTANAGAYAVSFYYGDSTSTTGLAYLDQVVMPAIPAGVTTATYTATLALPASVLFGDRWLHHFIDSSSNVAESDETDNRGYRALSITGKPDLQVFNLAPTPTTQFAGETVALAYRVRNTGASRATAFATRFYYSENNTISITDTYLNQEVAVAGLEAGAWHPEGGNGSVVVTIPGNAAAGARFLGAIADYSGQVAEGSEANNTAAAAVTVEAARPDLAISFWSAPASAQGAGTSLSVTYRVVNLGAQGSGACTVSFYYGDASSTTGLVLLHANTLPALAAGASSADFTFTESLPGDVLFGSRYLHYFLDSAAEVTESDETNNRGYRPLEITGRPNLRLTTLVPTPASGLAGASVSLAYRIANSGFSRVPSPFTTRFYYSADATVTTADTYLNQEVVVGSLKAGASHPEAGDGTVAVTVPASAQTGSRYLGAIADSGAAIAEGDEVDNASAAAFAVLAGPPDLVMVWFEAPASAAGLGSQVAMKYVVRNSGASPAGPFVVSFYYADTASPTGRTLLGSASMGGLAAGQVSAEFTYTATLPGNVLRGSRFLQYFVDAGGAVAEDDETNNEGDRALQISGLPDLKVSVFTLNPTSQAAGGTLDVRYRVTNAGVSRATAFKTRVYYSADDTVTTADTYLGEEYEVAELLAGATAPADGDRAAAVTVPASAAVGTRYLGAIADSGSAIVESSETNNSATDDFLVVPNLPDLQVQVTLDGGGTPSFNGRGSAVNYRLKVTNTGIVAVESAQVEVAYGETELPAGLVSMAAVGIGNVGPGGTVWYPSSTGWAAAALPASVASGAGWVHATVDPQNLVAESTEANNGSAAAITVTGKPDLVVTRLEASPGTQVRGQDVTLTWRIENQGPARAKGPFAVRFLYSADSTVDGSDTAVGSEVSVASLDSGVSWPADGPGTAVVTLPLSAVAGDGWLGALADAAGSVPEASEANNAGSAQVTVRKEKGAACADDEECGTGFCADGVCCESACGGSAPGDCQACNLAVKGACVPLAQGTVCRFAVPGGCDVDEACGGVSTECPVDVFVAAGEVCRAATDACDAEERCAGTAPECPPDDLLGDESACRPVAAACDEEERCTGLVPECPADGFLPEDVACRPVDGDCDVVEYCTGLGAACPKDRFMAEGLGCRAAAGECDLPETCTGEAGACPADAFVDAGEACGSAADSDCDRPDACDGAGACLANLAAAGTACRPAAGVCDVAEACDGAGACPPDALVDDGTPCDDLDACTLGDACSLGVCRGPAATDCSDGNACTADACDPATGCANTAQPDGTGCTDGDLCTDGDACAAGACVAGPPADCDDAEACTTDACDPATGCSHVPLPGCCSETLPCAVGYACEQATCDFRLCAECKEDAECGLGDDGVCVPMSEGSYCAAACTGAECPQGWVCSDVDGASLCMPEKGDCVCEAPEAPERCIGDEWVRLDACGRPDEVLEICANGCVDEVGCCPDGTRAQGGTCVAVQPEETPEASPEETPEGPVAEEPPEGPGPEALPEPGPDAVSPPEEGPGPETGAEAAVDDPAAGEGVPEAVAPGDTGAGEVPTVSSSGSGGGCASAGSGGSAAAPLALLLGVAAFLAVRRTRTPRPGLRRHCATTAPSSR